LKKKKLNFIKKYQKLEKDHKDHIELLSKSNANEKQEFANLKKISKDLEGKLAKERNNYEQKIKELAKVRDANTRLTQENERISSEYDTLQIKVENIGKMNAHYKETMQKLQDDNSAMAEYLEKQDKGKDSHEEKWLKLRKISTTNLLI